LGVTPHSSLNLNEVFDLDDEYKIYLRIFNNNFFDANKHIETLEPCRFIFIDSDYTELYRDFYNKLNYLKKSSSYFVEKHEFQSKLNFKFDLDKIENQKILKFKKNILDRLKNKSSKNILVTSISNDYDLFILKSILSELNKEILSINISDLEIDMHKMDSIARIVSLTMNQSPCIFYLPQLKEGQEMKNFQKIKQEEYYLEFEFPKVYYWQISDLNDDYSKYLSEFDYVFPMPEFKSFTPSDLFLLITQEFENVVESNFSFFKDNVCYNWESYKDFYFFLDFIKKHQQENNDLSFQELMKEYLFSIEGRNNIFMHQGNSGNYNLKFSVSQHHDNQFLNISPEKKEIVSYLENFISLPEQKKTSINLLFHGKPGTGKTEFAKELATILNRKLSLYSPSDLRHRYLGDSEKAIAKVFHDAEKNNSIILLDEIDSFLYKRNDDLSPWRIAIVNEFLTRMDSFRGIMIATTNQLKCLDPASKRRFTWKVEFFPTKKEQRSELIYNYFPHLRESDPMFLEDEIQNMDTLTPGDLKVVWEKFRFKDKEQIDDKIIINELKNELKYKQSDNLISDISSYIL